MQTVMNDAGVSYDEAVAALDKHYGDIVVALLDLYDRQGRDAPSFTIKSSKLPI